MIVCVCHRISDREIVRHARAGMGFDEIQLELGVATQCGQCEGCARDVVAQCSMSYPTAHIKLASNFPQITQVIDGSTWQTPPSSSQLSQQHS
ncbi:MAG: (2Fe-2S)-binding protein [Polaromonas sp.]|nr:(2Fe-2S)-binding protein [Polaromonas sp.]